MGVVLEVEVDEGALRDAGWHIDGDDCIDHTDDLQDEVEDLKQDCDVLIDAVQALHSQAHGDKWACRLCPMEPCRTVYYLIPDPTTGLVAVAS